MLENWLAVRGADAERRQPVVLRAGPLERSTVPLGRLGFRYERVRSEATGGIVGVDTDTVVPRLARPTT